MDEEFYSLYNKTKFNKGDFVTIRSGKTKIYGGIFIKYEEVDFRSRPVAVINVKYEASFFDKKEIDIINSYWLENVVKMSEEESKKFNWTLKEE